ncbi:M20 family metallo-hydrolase [Desulfurococcus amylolyticus]|uniref:Acetylornithine deacetylase or succinyl-diaminopimelate desuccinylase n=1 Tax=Desulfurococcus amylolyticus DSM 16532 TaxID=768672 RepID=I3XSM5_DESAM|nr:acetylornithine deacetylase or succinyl-diaminopimelate desuccinylase [Desulfurococcus amylolyticus DSM 16532]
MVIGLLDRVIARIDSMRDEMARTLSELISIPAIGPDNGGEGEYDKAARLLDIIKDWGFTKIERYDAPDPRVKHGVRPNILAYYEGSDPNASRLWILSHLDVVPPGDLSKWTVTKPFEPVIRDGKVYGRGSEDNGQAIVSSLYAVKALMELGVKPRRTVVLAFVSDEETGSKYGLGYLVEKHRELFRDNDLVLVPDAGVPDGSFIEIAEKSILWVKIKITGAQTHASTPHRGINAHAVASRITSNLYRYLYKKYSERDELFDPPLSTFEPTMTFNPSNAPNIIPGEYSVVFDCRILPKYSIDDVLRDMKNTCKNTIRRFKGLAGGKPGFNIEVLQRLDAPAPTPKDSEIVRLLERALREVRGIQPRVGGIGGGTVAALFRKIGLPAAVWSTIDEMAHQPNEYAKIDNLVNDAKVMAALMMY